MKASTGGYPAILVLSNQDEAKIRSLADGQSTTLNDPKYPRAQRVGNIVYVYAADGRSYEVRV